MAVTCLPPLLSKVMHTNLTLSVPAVYSWLPPVMTKVIYTNLTHCFQYFPPLSMEMSKCTGVLQLHWYIIPWNLCTEVYGYTGNKVQLRSRHIPSGIFHIPTPLNSSLITYTLQTQWFSPFSISFIIMIIIFTSSSSSLEPSMTTNFRHTE